MKQFWKMFGTATPAYLGGVAVGREHFIVGWLLCIVSGFLFAHWFEEKKND